MLRILCRTHTTLTEADIDQLETVSSSLPLMANLTSSDIFIDCMLRDGSAAIVVAEAKSMSGYGSAYIGGVVGKAALSMNEPAVFHAFQSGMPIRDLKAITQESISVKQDVVPIRNQAGQVIAVLIREKDVTEYVLQDKKYEELAKHHTDYAMATASPDITAMREVHHRVKNNLQTIASILNLQARKAESDEMRRAFKENVSRVLSIASIHDILTSNQSDGSIEIRSLIDKLRRNQQSMLVGEAPPTISIDGDELWLSADMASAVALCVNELIMNAVEHAFVGRSGGSIQVSVQNGARYCTVSVRDNGAGFQREAVGSSIGLSIVEATVKGKLKGTLKLQSGEDGTCAMLEFKK